MLQFNTHCKIIIFIVFSILLIYFHNYFHIAASFDNTVFFSIIDLHQVTVKSVELKKITDIQFSDCRLSESRDFEILKQYIFQSLITFSFMNTFQRKFHQNFPLNMNIDKIVLKQTLVILVEYWPVYPKKKTFKWVALFS